MAPRAHTHTFHPDLRRSNGGNPEARPMSERKTSKDLPKIKQCIKKLVKLNHLSRLVKPVFTVI